MSNDEDQQEGHEETEDHPLTFELVKGEDGALKPAVDMSKSMSVGAAMEEINRQSKATRDALKSFEGLKLGSTLGIASPAHTDFLKRLNRQTSTMRDAFKRVEGVKLGSTLGTTNAALTDLLKKLDRQNEALSSMRSSSLGPLKNSFDELETFARPSPVPEFHLPPSPVHETNDKLDRIERRFEQIHEVAANAAEIATGLQSYAADFLQKFEAAAADNNQSARRAIWLGGMAVAIALLVPIFQIGYTELWRAPNDAEALQALIAEMKSEIFALQEAQATSSDQAQIALEQLEATSFTTQPSQPQASLPLPKMRPDIVTLSTRN